MPFDVNKVKLAAQAAIERHGAQAIAVAEETLSISSNPEFALAVIAEIRRLLSAQDETYH